MGGSCLVLQKDVYMFDILEAPCRDWHPRELDAVVAALSIRPRRPTIRYRRKYRMGQNGTLATTRSWPRNGWHNRLVDCCPNEPKRLRKRPETFCYDCFDYDDDVEY